MRRWTGSFLIQVMYCCLFGAITLLNLCLSIDNWTPKNKLQRNCLLSPIIFIQENVFENVIYEMLVILYQPRWTKCANTDMPIAFCKLTALMTINSILICWMNYHPSYFDILWCVGLSITYFDRLYILPSVIIPLASFDSIPLEFVPKVRCIDG